MGHFSDASVTIVIFRALQLGDLLCTVPSFRALRAGYPQARITLVGLPWAEAFVRRFSHYLDDFIEFPGWPGLPEREPDVQQIPDFLKMIQERRFDLALQMQGSGEITNILVDLFGAQQAAGFFRPGQYRPFGDLFFEYPQGASEIRKFLKLVEGLGIPSQGEHLEFPLTDEEKQTFVQFFSAVHLEPGKYVCLHPGARFTGRRWPPEKFALVGDALAKAGYQIVVTGTEAERALTGAVVQNMRCPALDTAGQTGLGTLALLIANARLLVSNDTGVSHIAAAMQTPSVILFTVSEPERWRPLDHHRHRIVTNAYNASAGDILAEAENLLREAPSHAARAF